MTRGLDTKERLLDAAERLYSERGIDATSLRRITRAASVHLAAVNYHFGSKRGLTEAVFARRLLPLAEERWARLLELEERAAAMGREPGVREILETFVRPLLTLAQDPARGGHGFLRLLGRIYTEPSEEFAAVIAGPFRDTVHRFIIALERAAPTLSTARPPVREPSASSTSP